MPAQTAPPTPITPPFTAETAAAKVQAAEDAWNSHDPQRVSMAYSEHSVWRNRDEFFEGREAIREFLTRKWAKELDYKLMKELWAFTADRISVRFEYEWHDAAGQWYRTHGNEHWEFDDDGLMHRRDMSANDIPIEESQRRL
jgi:nuclear transport factor 2 (NTF2) superfamily protein